MAVDIEERAATGLEKAIEHAVASSDKSGRAGVVEKLRDTVELLGGIVCPGCKRTGMLEPRGQGLVCSHCGFGVPVARDFSLLYEVFIDRFFRGTLVVGRFPGVGRFFISRYGLGNKISISGERVLLEELVVNTCEGEEYVIAVRFPHVSGSPLKGDALYSGYVCSSGLVSVNLSKR